MWNLSSQESQAITSSKVMSQMRNHALPEVTAQAQNRAGVAALCTLDHEISADHHGLGCDTKLHKRIIWKDSDNMVATTAAIIINVVSV